MESGCIIKVYIIEKENSTRMEVAVEINHHVSEGFDIPILIHYPIAYAVTSKYEGEFDTYIIMQGKDELYIFDQHAAHERVFYEKFMRGYNDSSHSPQPLLTSFTISVSPDVYSMDRGWLEDLGRMGYDIEDFGSGAFIVRGIPPYMEAGEARGFAEGYAEAAGEAGGVNRAVIDKLIMRSCKSAVKAHDKLSEMEISDLISKLAECDNPYSCPHGRPTFIRVSAYDMERSFRRK